MARNIGATLSLNNGNFFTNMKSAINASNKLKGELNSTTGGLKNFGAQSNSAGNILTSLASKAAVAVAAFVSIRQAVNFGKDIIEIGSAYQDSVAKVSTIADTTVKSISALSTETIALSNATGVAAADLNESLYQAISAGADTAHATELVAVAVKAAKGGFTDTTTAVDGLTSVLNTYGMATGDAQSLANKFLITQNKGKTSFGELATTIGQVAPVAKSSGVSIDELLSGVASLTANGLSTSSAMTGLKAALSNIIKPTSDAQKTAATLGLDFSTTALKAQGLSGFMKTLQEKTGGNTNTMAKLFGSVEGLNAMLTLTSNGGMKLMTDTMSEMKTNTTALEDAYSAMTDTVSAQTDIFKNKLSNMKISIFENLDGSKFVDVIKMASSAVDKLTPTITNVTVAIGNGLFAAIQGIYNIASTVFNAVKNAIENNQPAIENLRSAFDNVKNSIVNAFSGNGTALIQTLANVIIPGLCNSLSLVMNTASGVISVASTLSPVIAGIAGAVTAYKVAVAAANAVESIRNGLIAFSAIMTGTQAAAFAPLTTATIAQIAATSALNVVTGAFGAIMTFVTSPIGLVVIAIGAVIAVGVLLVKHWDTVKQWAQNLWNGIKNVFSGIKNTISNAWNSVKEKASVVWGGIKDVVSAKLNNIKSAYNEHGGGIKGVAAGYMTALKEYYTIGYDAINALTGGKLGQVVESVKAKLAPMANAVKEKLSGVKDAFGSAFSNAVDFVKTSYNEGALKPIVDKIAGAFSTVKTAIAEKFNGIKETVGSKLTAIGEAAVGIKDKIAEKFTTVKDAVAEKFSVIKDAVVTALSPLTDSVSTVISGIRTVISSIVDGIKTYITNTVENIRTTVTNIAEGVKNNFTNFFTSIQSAFQGVWTGIQTVFEGIKNVIVGVFQTIVGIFTLNIDTIKNGVASIKTGFTTAFEGIRTVVSNVWNAITSAASLVWNNITTVVSGAVNGVKTQISTVTGTVSSVFSSVKSTISNTFESVKSKAVSVFENVKSTILNAINTIKGYFNFSWSLPKIKLPHFKISGSFSLNPPSTPSFGVEWYRKGGIMTRPTLFGINGNNMMGGGEAGPEAILPLAQFWNNLRDYLKAQTPQPVPANNNYYVTVKVDGGNSDDDTLANKVAKRIIDALENM